MQLQITKTTKVMVAYNLLKPFFFQRKRHIHTHTNVFVESVHKKSVFVITPFEIVHSWLTVHVGHRGSASHHVLEKILHYK